ncbi:spondin domain-containing protein [Vibrio lentus]|nr:spondin domain-containing protein [Vibrio lentus]
MFRTGETASAELESMAEGGDISGLSSLIANAGGVVVENPAIGILNPGVATTFDIDTGDLAYLSLGARWASYQRWFCWFRQLEDPNLLGTYKATLNGYDAGTEANDELAGSMPNPSIYYFGAGGTGVETVVSNAKVHIHPGNIAIVTRLAESVTSIAAVIVG